MAWVSSGILQGLLSGFGFIEGTQAPDFDMGFSISFRGLQFQSLLLKGPHNRLADPGLL